MQVFDLRRLRGLDGSEPVTFDADVVYDGVASAHNVVINEETGFAYVVGAAGGGETCGGGCTWSTSATPRRRASPGASRT